MKREEKKKKKRLSYAGTSSDENHANFAFLLLYSSIQISPFLTLQISLSFANFSHFQLGELRKKLAGELNFFVIFVCIKGYQSSDSLPFKEAFVKRVSIRCNTHASGWLNGAHPTVADGQVTRTVCFHWDSNCCKWSSSVKVINCGGYYVYYITGTPECALRYCSTD